MLRITIPSDEYWDERKQEFVYVEGGSILMEHSLAAIAKWEAKWKKPYLTNEPKSRAEKIDYVRCMTTNKDQIGAKVYDALTLKDLERIDMYIGDPMTATTFSNRGPKGSSREQITSELIYYWMVALQIPFECQYWHLNRLLTLVRICNIKNQPSKKQSVNTTLSQNAALNAARKKKLGTTG